MDKVNNDFYISKNRKTRELAKKFEEDLLSGEIKKDYLPNHSEDFDGEQASKNIDTFTKSNLFKKICFTI